MWAAKQLPTVVLQAPVHVSSSPTYERSIAGGGSPDQKPNSICMIDQCRVRRWGEPTWTRPGSRRGRAGSARTCWSQSWRSGRGCPARCPRMCAPPSLSSSTAAPGGSTCAHGHRRQCTLKTRFCGALCASGHIPMHLVQAQSCVADARISEPHPLPSVNTHDLLEIPVSCSLCHCVNPA